jgi:hypothetical protein
MADAKENLRNWLVAERGGEFKVFAHLEWMELGPDGCRIVADNLTEEEAAADLVRRAPPDQRAT